MIDTMHLFVTNKCTNNCPLCCNKNYDIEKIPLPTEEELGSIGDKLNEIKLKKNYVIKMELIYYTIVILE